MYRFVERPPCPVCQQVISVVFWSKNTSSKTQRFKCNDCNKTYTKNPKSNRVTPEKEQLILRLLEEKLSVEAIARATHSAKKTIYDILKKHNLRLMK